MRITILGKAVLFLIFLTLWNAVNGGLNTLYMLYSALAAAIAVAWIGVRAAALGVTVKTILPDQIFCDEYFPIRLEIRNRLPLPIFGILVSCHSGLLPINSIGERKTVTTTVSYRIARRGLNVINDLRLEFSFPFSLFIRMKKIPIKDVLAFPAITRLAGRPRPELYQTEDALFPKRGAGDEFWGVRELGPDDDAKQISWKLSAKAAKPLIKEYAELAGNRVVITVSGAPENDATEFKIREAAAAARFFIDEGSFVRLITDEGDTGFGRGLLHLEMILKHLAILGQGKRLPAPVKLKRKKWTLPAIENTGPLHSLLYILAAALTASLWLVEGLDIPTKAGMCALLPLAWMLNRRGIYPIPSLVLNIMSLAVIAAVFFIDIPAKGLLVGLTHLLCYALANLLISKKPRNNTGPILLVCFLLFIVISWQTVDVYYFAVFTAVFLFLGFLLTQTGSLSAGLNSKKILAVSASTVLVFAIAGIVFAATPRIRDPRMANFMRRIGLANLVAPDLSIVKLSDEMELGIFNDVRTNTRRAMQVKITDFNAETGATIKIRAGTLNHFDGKRWTRVSEDFIYNFMGNRAESSEGLGYYEKFKGYFVSNAFRSDQNFIREEFFLSPMGTNLIFSIGDPTAISENIFQPAFDATDTLYAAFPFEAGGHYVVLSGNRNIDIGGGIDNYESILEALFLELPYTKDMSIVRQMADSITQAIHGDEKKAKAIEDYFKNNFRYSYMAKHGRQGIGDFLTKTRAANCEYFSSAMALMLRHLGIPSRIAIGYLAGDFRKAGGYFDVRNSDGHAWVEAYIRDKGWLTYDPTPMTVELPAFSFPFGREIYMYFLDMQMSWYRYVIGYDFYVQQDTIAALISKWREAVVIAVTSIVALVLVIFAAIGAHSLFGGKTKAAASHPATTVFYSALKILRRHGLSPKQWQTPMEFSKVVSAKEPRLDIFEGFVTSYYEWRYGRASGREAKERLKKLRARW